MKLANDFFTSIYNKKKDVLYEAGSAHLSKILVYSSDMCNVETVDFFFYYGHDVIYFFIYTTADHNCAR